MCDHKNISGHYCKDCRLYLQEFSNDVELLIPAKEDIFAPVRGIVREDIISKAREICNSYNLRKDKKTAFQSLFLAHIQCQIMIEGLTLAKYFGLTRKHYNKCMADITDSSLTNTRLIDDHISVIIVLPETCMIDMLSGVAVEPKVYKDLIKLCKLIVEKNIPKVYSCQPQILAYTILTMYCRKNNMRIPKVSKRFSEKQMELYKPMVFTSIFV